MFERDGKSSLTSLQGGMLRKVRRFGTKVKLCFHPSKDVTTGGRGGGANGKKVRGRRPPSSKINGWTRVDARPPCTDPIRGWTPSNLENKWVDAVHLRPPTLAALLNPNTNRQVRKTVCKSLTVPKLLYDRASIFNSLDQ